MALRWHLSLSFCYRRSAATKPCLSEPSPLSRSPALRSAHAATIRVSLEEFEDKQPQEYWDGMVAEISKSKQWLVDLWRSWLRSLFTGAYCDNSRLSMAAIGQVSAWMRGFLHAAHGRARTA